MRIQTEDPAANPPQEPTAPATASEPEPQTPNDGSSPSATEGEGTSPAGTSAGGGGESTTEPVETPPVDGSAREPSSPPEDTDAAPDVVELIGDGGLDAVEGWIGNVLPFYEDAPWLQMITVIVLFTLAATVVSWVLKRVGAGALAKTDTQLDDNILSALSSPIYTTMIAIGVRIGVERLELSDIVTERIADVLATWVVLVWLIAAFQISGLVLSALASNENRFSMVEENTVPLLDNLIKVVLFLVATYTVLNIWEQNVSGLLAAGGVAGLAVGFAARDTLANLFAGVFIFADSPYKIGDFINLDSGERGMVTQIGIRSTRLRTRDDVEITIPNAVMGGAKIVNESGGSDPRYRVRVKVGIAYGADIDEARQTLLDIAHDNELVTDEPSPRVRFRTFGASSLDLELLCWIEEPVLRGRALDALNTEVYKRFMAHSIEIPYSKHDLYIKEIPSTRPATDDEDTESSAP